jgi:hypothetical protein
LQICSRNTRSLEYGGFVKGLRPNCKTSTPGSNPGGASNITGSIPATLRKPPRQGHATLAVSKEIGLFHADDVGPLQTLFDFLLAADPGLCADSR